MLLLNESKDWFENYSKAGKDAIRFNKILKDTKLSLERKQKRKKLSNACLEISVFESQENKKDLIENVLDESLDIFKDSFEENKKIKNEKILNQKLELKNKYKYHDRHMNNFKKKENKSNPSCRKYNPKYDSILKVPQSIPSWEKQLGRKPPKIKEICDKFYIEHDNIIDTMAGTAFIDMSKQIEKQSSFENKEKDILIDNYSIVNINNNNFEYNINFENDLSYRPASSVTKDFTKPSSRMSNKSNNENNNNIKNNNNKSVSSRIGSARLVNKKIISKIFDKKHKKDNTSSNVSILSETRNDLSSQRNININDSSKVNDRIGKRKIQNQTLNSVTSALSSNNSIDIFNRYYIKRMRQIKTKKKLDNLKGNPRNKNIRSSLSQRSKIKAPDFSKNLSRESLDKLKDNKEVCIPYLIPKYTQVRERPIMMVSYSKKKDNKNRAQSSRATGLNYSYYYNPDKALDKINNHSTIHVPDFDLMSSRPIDNNPLPSYMKKIIDRSGITEFSLNMNNYSNRDFGNLKTSFFPKRSFNKVINLNLLRSKKFFGNFVFGNKDKKIFGKNGHLLSKIIRFYNQNFDNILKEKNLEKFDNVTYKGYENSNRKKLYK